MAYWESEAVEMLRVMTDDLGDSPRVSDATLLRVLVVSAFQVSLDADFSREFVVDIDAQSISPDPAQPGQRDDSFINLVALKAACTIDRGQAGRAAGRAILARDGGSTIDAREVAKHRIALLQRGGWCAAYSDELADYESGRTAVAGAMVLTPFRLYAWGSRYGPSRGCP